MSFVRFISIKGAGGLRARHWEGKGPVLGTGDTVGGTSESLRNFSCVGESSVKCQGQEGNEGLPMF